MELIDAITVRNRGREQSITLHVGDLSSLPREEAVDVLVVSAFPGDYFPTSTSLIGALEKKGVVVASLACDKEVDLRGFSSCWLSRPIDVPGIHFKRILCFEPKVRGKAPELVGDIFRSIIPFTAGIPPVARIAMPLVASGDQGEPPQKMLEALLEASLHWLSHGLAVDRILIVIRDTPEVANLLGVFATAKRRFAEEFGIGSNSFRYDLFVSYSHNNMGDVMALVDELKTRRSSLRIFMDRMELRSGSAWQQHIFESIDHSRKFLCAFSPDYLASKICKEEYNIALFRHRETSGGVLLPCYLYSAELPTYMRVMQYEDVREGNREKIKGLADKLLEQL